MLCNYYGQLSGQTVVKGIFLPASDFEDLTLETLTFPEFAEVFGKREVYESKDLFGGSDSEQYKKLKACFELYQRIGVYPSVVNMYLEYKSLERYNAELGRLMSIFTNIFII